MAEVANAANIALLCARIFFFLISHNASISKNVLKVFRVALTSGNILTSNIPSIPSGRGPKIRNATASVITIETI